MKNFGGNAKLKGTCSQSKWLVDIKLFHLFAPIGQQSKHVSCALCYPQENLVAKNVDSQLYAAIYSVIKCINSIKANTKAERLFQMFCKANHACQRQWRN